MTRRKPTDMSFEDWTERQIREARERGAFDDLPGAGPPMTVGLMDVDEVVARWREVRADEVETGPGPAGPGDGSTGEASGPRTRQGWWDRWRRRHR